MARHPRTLRDPLPRSESYPLSRSEVNAALDFRNVQNLRLIYFLRGGQRWASESGSVIEANFRAGSAFMSGLELRVYAVPVLLKAEISSALQGGVLDHVARWLADAGASTSTWRFMSHSLTYGWHDGAFRRKELDGLSAEGWGTPW